MSNQDVWMLSAEGQKVDFFFISLFFLGSAWLSETEMTSAAECDRLMETR